MHAADLLGETSGSVTPSAETPQRLVVAWQHPIQRSIEPVGFLTFDGHSYRFGYIRNVLSVVDFRPLLGFPDLHGSYESTELFPLFAQRAMDPRRPDYQRYVESLGLEGEPGPLEQITRSEGRRQGDTIQLLPEPVAVGDEISYLFLVHGIRHAHEDPRILHGQPIHVTAQQVEDALASLRGGDELLLAAEPSNPANPLALMVVGSEAPIGWVPNLLAEDIQRLIHHTPVQILVEHVNGPDAPWHLRLLARLRAPSAGDFKFFTDEQWQPLAQ